MKKNLLLSSIFLLLFFTNSFCQKAKDVTILVSSNQDDATILVNGKSVGNGSAKVKLLGNSCTKISAKKEGLYVKEVEYCNNGLAKLPKAVYLELDKDDAYEASVKTDIANVDINIRPKRSQSDSWKAINSLVLQYIDAIEVSDKDNFYLKTAWVAQTFKSATIRTRIIVKTSGQDQFSIKILSEASGPGTSVKEDQWFTSWDRVLRKYANTIENFKTGFKA